MSGRLGMTGNRGGYGIKMPKPPKPAVPEAPKPDAVKPTTRVTRTPTVAMPKAGHPKVKPPGPVTKAETTMDEKNARKLVRTVGDRGPLPKGMPREERMRAYEARYVAAGGPKGEKWNRRAKGAEATSVAGGAVSGAGAAGLLAAGKNQRVRRIARPAMLSGTAVWGLGGLAAHDARRRRASYKSSPAGVAASALTRMRNYSQE